MSEAYDESLVSGIREPIDDEVDIQTPSNFKIFFINNSNELAGFYRRINIGEVDAQTHKFLQGMVKLIGGKVTVVCENDYVDELYRDTYYMYFAKKHTPVERYCTRISLFKGEICGEKFNYYDDNAAQYLQSHFVGVCIIRPLKNRRIGQTILSARQLSLPNCKVQSARFHFSVLGHPLYVDGSPFVTQDAETMSCAEVTVWSMMEYFGTRYPRHNTVLPSEIATRLENLSDERVLPARGLKYAWISALLKSFHFSPKLYVRKAYEGSEDDMRNFKRIFHYYIDSDMPVAVGISGKQEAKDVKHSVVCIGYGCNMKKPSEEYFHYFGSRSIYPYVDSADLFDHYVIMDDCDIPYQVNPFGSLGWLASSEVSTFAVPINPDVFLEAPDVSEIVHEVLTDEMFDLSEPIRDSSIEDNEHILEISIGISKSNPLVVRVLLTSSTDFRNFRAKFSGNKDAAIFYGSFQLPKYIWVAEVSTYNSFKDKQIYGEILNP